MRIVCIYTKEHNSSIKIANRCISSGKKFGYNVELYAAVFWKNLNKIHKDLGLKQKYIPCQHTIKLTSTKCSAARMANGTTHYMLYKWAVEHDEPICILEHDAIFVGTLPKVKYNGVIQISSHRNGQSTKEHWFNCTRARKTRKYQPNFKLEWDNTEGIIKHPLSGLNGTSGYIIYPDAALKMINYIKMNGIAFADRVRTEFIGEDNLYLQVPQSIICDHSVRSAVISKYD